jgi:hypothetical protein
MHILFYTWCKERYAMLETFLVDNASDKNVFDLLSDRKLHANIYLYLLDMLCADSSKSTYEII